MDRSTRRGAASAKRPRKGSARDNWDRAEADQARREKTGDGAGSMSKVRRTGSGSGHARTTPAARKRIASAPREADAAEQPRIPTSRVTRRGTAPEAPAGGDGEAGDAADEEDPGAVAGGEAALALALAGGEATPSFAGRGVFRLRPVSWAAPGAAGVGGVFLAAAATVAAWAAIVWLGGCGVMAFAPSLSHEGGE